MPLMPLSILLTACNPQDATIEGDFLVVLSADSSENVRRVEGREKKPKQVIEGGGFSEWDCRDLTSFMDSTREDEEKEARESGADLDDEDVQAQIDENVLDAADEERLGDLVWESEDGEDYFTTCCEPVLDDAGNALPVDASNCEPIEPKWFLWVDQYSYWAKQTHFKSGGKTAPWRSEAVLTSEGDLQLTVHVRQQPFGDFRFGWVIDPDFQPTRCVDGDGGSVLEEDGGNWLEGWSLQEDDATMYYLNSGAYQINPSDTAVYWSFPEEWKAGYTFARYADEEFYGHSTDYADAEGYPLYHPKYHDFQRDRTLDFPARRDDYAAWVAEVDRYFNGGTDEDGEEVEPLQDLVGLTDSFEGEKEFPVAFEVEDNAWRYPLDAEGEPLVEDYAEAGLEQWTGVNISYVRIKNPGDIKAHNEVPIEGEFQIYLESAAAASKILVKGSFTLENIREDVWGRSPTLDEEKRAENDTPECGEERLTTDE